MLFLNRPCQPVRFSAHVDVAGDLERFQVDHSDIVVRRASHECSRFGRINQNSRSAVTDESIESNSFGFVRAFTRSSPSPAHQIFGQFERQPAFLGQDLKGQAVDPDGHLQAHLLVGCDSQDTVIKPDLEDS